MVCYYLTKIPPTVKIGPDKIMVIAMTGHIIADNRIVVADFLGRCIDLILKFYGTPRTIPVFYCNNKVNGNISDLLFGGHGCAQLRAKFTWKLPC